MKLSIFLILPVVLITALFFVVVLGLVYKAFARRPVTGSEGLIGLEGSAQTDISKDGGMAFIRGEIWQAYSDENISKGEKIAVEKVTGLKVKVKKLKKEQGG